MKNKNPKLSNSSDLDLPLISLKNSTLNFQRRDTNMIQEDNEFIKNSTKMSKFIDREYDNFINQLEASSKKYYVMTLKGTLAKQKYREEQVKKEIKNARALSFNKLKLILKKNN